MLSNKAEEQLAEILVQRINKVNADILTEIGKSLKEISTLNISKARQLQMMLKYGADYNKIARILAKISGKNVQDIYKIFKEVARTNKDFAKEFYQYRNIAYVPYNQDRALQRQVLAMANITADLYKNLTNTSGIGLMVDGNFRQLQTAYSEIIDRAITSVIQGKEDYYKVMRRTLKEVGGNGLLVYESGRTRRLDSAVRMNILDGIRMVNNETNRLFGEEYGADGVEITVHENPAPDHEEVQGRQFNNDEYRRLQEEGTALTVEGDTIDISNGKGHRPISELNCYHRPMNIIVGVSQPQYTKEQLQEIRDRNNKGFEYEGKHYTMYEGTQLQRRLETAIRRNKDTQILARASGDTELAKESQIKINLLSKKYDELNKVSGLSSEKDRLTVSGYRPIKVEMPKEKVAVPKVVQKKLTPEQYDEEFYVYAKKLDEKGIDIRNSVFNICDAEFRNKQVRQLDVLTDKYPSRNNLYVEKESIGSSTFGDNSFRLNRIRLNTKYFDNKELLIREEKDCQVDRSWLKNTSWHVKVKEEDLDIYTITHEYGHTVENDWIKEIDRSPYIMIQTRKQYDKDLKDTLVERAISKLDKKMTKTEFYNTYFSGYARAKRNYEWFAEAFTQVELGTESNVWTETFKEWLDGRK